MLVQWVDLLSRQLCSSEVAGEWFLSHMADDYWWPLEIFIKFPNQMVRQTFQRLCLQIISKLRPQHAPLYLKAERQTAPDSNSSVTKFINMLLNLVRKLKCTKKSPFCALAFKTKFKNVIRL